jgi:hypothetical protein
MKIITISGKAQHGKDFTAEVMADILEDNGYKVLITHYADLLKFICKSLFGWDGEKDDKGRKLLQYVGTDVVRKKKPDFWVDYMIAILTIFKDEWDYVIIPDTRFPNEIINLKLYGFDVASFQIIREDYDNGLSKEANAHESEHALDDFNFDYVLHNDGTDFYKKVVALALDSIYGIFNEWPKVNPSVKYENKVDTFKN